MPEHVAIGEGENFLNLDPEIHGENLKISVAGDYKSVGYDEKTVRLSGHVSPGYGRRAPIWIPMSRCRSPGVIQR